MIASHLALTTKAPSSSRFKRVCVHGGRSYRKRESYKCAASRLGEELAVIGLDLVCNGSITNLLSVVAQAA